MFPSDSILFSFFFGHFFFPSDGSPKRSDRDRERDRDRDRDRGRDRDAKDKESKDSKDSKDAAGKDKEVKTKKPANGAGGGVDLFAKLAKINARVTGVTVCL